MHARDAAGRRCTADLQPSPLLLRWLRLMWSLARPLAAVGVPPTALTAGRRAACRRRAAARRPAAAGRARPRPRARRCATGWTARWRSSRGGRRASAPSPTRSPTGSPTARSRAICGAAARRGGWPLLAGGLSLAHELLRVVRGGRIAHDDHRRRAPDPGHLHGPGDGQAAVSAASWPPTVCAAVSDGRRRDRARPVGAQMTS